MLIFHRDPALILAFFASLVSLASNYVLHWSDSTQGYVNATALALVGLVTAWSVAREKLAAAILGLGAAVINLAISFGAHITVADQTVLTTALATGVAMFIRTQVTARVDEHGVLVA